jgi:hypothetical protein
MWPVARSIQRNMVTAVRRPMPPDTFSKETEPEAGTLESCRSFGTVLRLDTVVVEVVSTG